MLTGLEFVFEALPPPVADPPAPPFPFPAVTSPPFPPVALKIPDMLYMPERLTVAVEMPPAAALAFCAEPPAPAVLSLASVTSDVVSEEGSVRLRLDVEFPAAPGVPPAAAPPAPPTTVC